MTATDDVMADGLCSLGGVAGKRAKAAFECMCADCDRVLPSCSFNLIYIPAYLARTPNAKWLIYAPAP